MGMAGEIYIFKLFSSVGYLGPYSKENRALVVTKLALCTIPKPHLVLSDTFVRVCATEVKSQPVF